MGVAAAAAAWQQQLGGSGNATAAAVTAAQQRAISCRQGEFNNQQGREACRRLLGWGNSGGSLRLVPVELLPLLKPWDPRGWTGKAGTILPEYPPFLDFFVLLLGEGVDRAEFIAK